MASAMLKNAKKKSSDKARSVSDGEQSKIAERKGKSIPVTIPLGKLGNIFTNISENTTDLPHTVTSEMLSGSAGARSSSQGGGDVESRSRETVVNSSKSFEHFTESITNLTNTMAKGFDSLRSDILSYDVYDDEFCDDDDLDEEYISADESDDVPKKKAKTTGVTVDDLFTNRKNDSGSTLNVSPPNKVKDKSDFLKIISEQLTVQDQVTDPIDGKLAELVDGLLLKDVASMEKKSDDKLKEASEKIKRPENCESLVTTRVEEIIWNRLQTSTRSLDARFQMVQGFLVKGMTILVTLIDKLIASTNEVEKVDLVKSMVDSIDLLSYANLELNLRRRECLKSDIDSETYLPLFSSNVPVNKWLFGGDLSKRLDDIEKVNKAVNKVMNKSKRGRGRYRGYYPRRGFAHGRGYGSDYGRRRNFLGYGNRRGGYYPARRGSRGKRKAE